LLAKLVVHGSTRDEALTRARAAATEFEISGPERGGVKTNLPFLVQVLASAEFASGDYDTGIVSRLR
jgi:acetyl-CoA carboxylase biotin carboxylase subunit